MILSDIMLEQTSNRKKKREEEKGDWRQRE